MRIHALRYAAALTTLLAVAAADLPSRPLPEVAGGQRPATRVCVARADAGWVAGACRPVADADWFADAEARAAWGLPACWWTADATAFAGVRGVGDVLAVRLVAFRDAGGRLHDVGAVRGVGPVLERAIGAAVTDACPRAQGADTRPGLRLTHRSQ